MKKLLTLLLLSLICSAAYAQENSEFTRIIAGSRADKFCEVFAADDGCILAAGFTFSSDGDLSDRTKTGRSGWLCSLDERGNVLWNFCSRNSQNDEILAPRKHGDGTITVLLRSDGHEYNQLDLIRLSSEGKQIDRKTLFKLSQEEAHCMLTGPKVFAGGYIVDVFQHSKPYEPVYHWFDFSGKLLKTTSGISRDSIAAVSENHIVQEKDGVYWLCKLDESGDDTPICRLPEGVQYYGLVSLEHGGAAVCGGRANDQGRKGLLLIYDAAGNRTAAFRFEGYILEKVLLHENGYVLSAVQHEDEGIVFHMTEDGTVTAKRELMFSASSYYPYIAQMPDGRIVFVSSKWGDRTDGSDMVNYDAVFQVLDLR